MHLKIKVNDVVPDSAAAVRVAGRGIFSLIQAHLRTKNENTPPKTGFPKSNYWALAADSMNVTTSGNKAIVTVEKEGAALHYYGGTVRAKKKALAIPLSGIVAGIWPSEYGGGLALIKDKGKDQAYLKDTESDQLLYLLVPSVDIPKDPTVLPSDDAIYNAAMDALLEMKK